MPARIEDYAMIGDMRTAALVGRDGSIDWFCVPRFDSGACFAALVGTEENGHWKIAPRAAAKVRRHYQNGGLILETRFTNEGGSVSVVDFMPVGEADTSIVRLVIGREGKMSMQTQLVIRFDYGVSVPWVNRVDNETLTAIAGPSMLVLRTPVRLHGQDLHTEGRFTVKKGQTIPFALTYVPSHLQPPPPPDVQALRERTEEFWRDWSRRCEVKGKWSKHVRRSLVTLKGLSFRATGGIVAAPTTSLPEKLGGVRNWDYRYCWLRDAAFTLLALLNAGYTDEADDWQNWLLRAAAGSPDQLQIMYGVAGERDLPERELDWLTGHADSRPVRVGNAASDQMQLDIYGELADVIKHAALGGLAAAPRREELRVAFLKHLEKVWRLPDYGIWEIRGEPQHFVHSKVMAWVAFDRAWRARESAKNKSQRAHWKKLAAEVHADICRQGVDSARGCFVQAYGSQGLDAALLLLPIVGFLPPTDTRIEATVAEIERCLMAGGLVLRYQTASGVDNLPQGEGAFLPCSFWLVELYVLMGRQQEAVRLFERLLKCRNDVGLLSEEYDPRAKRMLGNFPQAFSHVALINSALCLLHATGKGEQPRPQMRHQEISPPTARRKKA
ncbi:glycoside hydrolase family 15 protein [Ramlibacter monticola]|uniref:glycoside hydrolase family 15 protein n=1 Tax=Ramlibacter monticola TaxID=1926872 RepID=UPI001F3EEAC8|nr:glycoside hydrolase family 15 protein [Ramlibacter monticola]